MELERQIELRCLAPEGIPPPDVTWLRNGVPVEPKKEGSNLTVSSKRHLLVVQARLADVGNYTCVSENVAGKRLSDTAVLTVFGKQEKTTTIPNAGSVMSVRLSPDEAVCNGTSTMPNASNDWKSICSVERVA